MKKKCCTYCDTQIFSDFLCKNGYLFCLDCAFKLNRDKELEELKIQVEAFRDLLLEVLK